jgi:high-affinity Fe2+/Pb2+ permease
MKFLRWVLLYRTRPGAILSTVMGSIGILLGVYLVVIAVLVHRPRDSTLTRVESMLIYLILGTVLLGGGIVSLIQLDAKEKTQREWIAKRAAEWAALPMGDPRRKDPPGHWEP